MKKLRELLNPMQVWSSLVMILFLIGLCSLTGFMSVYLNEKGIPDTDISTITALLSCLSIVLQLVISRFSDRHPRLRLRAVLIPMSLVVLLCSFVETRLVSAPMVIAALVILSVAFFRGMYGFVNATVMQYVNQGARVNFGVARGLGSASYALASYVLGNWVARVGIDVLPYVTVGVLAAIIALYAVQPKVRRTTQGVDEKQTEAELERLANDAKISYLKILRTYPALTFLLLSCVLSAIGQYTTLTFMNRILEGVGGNVANLGVCSFIQTIVEIPMMFASQRLLKRFKPYTILLFSFFCYFVRTFALAFAGSVAAVYAVSALSIFCFGLYGFASVVLINEIVPEHVRVRAQSLQTMCYTVGLGNLLGALLSTQLIGHLTVRALMLVGSGFCLAAVGTMFVCASLCKRNERCNQKCSQTCGPLCAHQ